MKNRKSIKSSKMLLRERIERNMEEFKEEMSRLDSSCVFELASNIAAASDVHFYITTHDWANEDEADYLLQFENPLRMLADAWEEYSMERDHEFSHLVSKVVREDDSDYYMTVSTADELREKYGDDVPTDTAALLEIVELGKKFLNLREDNDSSDDSKGYDL